MGRPPCTLTILLIFFILLGGVPYPESVAEEQKVINDEVYANGVLKIVEVCPAFGSEFVRLRNEGESIIDLSRWSLQDGEGDLNLDGVIIERDGSAYICSDKEVLERMVGEVRSFSIGVDVTVSRGRFALSDQGDEVFLRSPTGKLEDVFVYGESLYSGQGWIGAPFPKISRGESAIRADSKDTDTSSDWKESSPGRSSFRPMTFPCWAEPLIWPDNALQMLMREIDYATKSVIICLYSLDFSQVLENLCRRANEGLSVNMLLEGQPVSGLSDEDQKALSALLDSGVRVVLAKSYDSYKRYDYFHCKYAVFDGLRSVVMSENWLQNSFSQNRGWGVVAESKELAAYLISLFQEDSDERRLDISEPLNLPKIGEGSDIPPVEHIPAPEGFDGLVTPIISPDFSLEMITGMIAQAERRILVEQFNCDQYGQEMLIPGLLQAAKRGVEVKVLLDSSWFNRGGGGNIDVIEMVNASRGPNIDIQARLVSNFHNFSLLHNKGMIVDDKVIVSSINWCQNAFLKNREVGLVIESFGLAKYFTSIFEQDWCIDPISPSVKLSSPSSVITGEPSWFDASGSSDNAGHCQFRWFLDGEVLESENGSALCISLPPGIHRVSVLVRDTSGNEALSEVSVDVISRESNFAVIWLSLPLAPSFLVALLWLQRKKLSGNKTSKGRADKNFPPRRS